MKLNIVSSITFERDLAVPSRVRCARRNAGAYTDLPQLEGG
jgi:hypothetical protein